MSVDMTRVIERVVSDSIHQWAERQPNTTAEAVQVALTPYAVRSLAGSIADDLLALHELRDGC